MSSQYSEPNMKYSSSHRFDSLDSLGQVESQDSKAMRTKKGPNVNFLPFNFGQGKVGTNRLWSFPLLSFYITHARLLQGNLGLSLWQPLGHPGFFRTYFPLSCKKQFKRIKLWCPPLCSFGSFWFPTNRMCLGQLAHTVSIRSCLVGSWSWWVQLMWEPWQGHWSLFQSCVWGQQSWFHFECIESMIDKADLARVASFERSLADAIDYPSIHPVQDLLEVWGQKCEGENGRMQEEQGPVFGRRPGKTKQSPSRPGSYSGKE